MKAVRFAAATLAVLAASFAVFAQTNAPATAQSGAQKSFDTLKSLTGSWEGKNTQGAAVQVSFRVTSSGSAIMSEIGNHGDGMNSMINMDGADRLLLTHYCSAGNQPRMQATASPDGKTITFNFMDATNLATPQSGRMDHVVIAVLDANHHTEDWTFKDHGKEMKEFFDLSRKN
jgi:hypothetical protein